MNKDEFKQLIKLFRQKGCKVIGFSHRKTDYEIQTLEIQTYCDLINSNCNRGEVREFLQSRSKGLYKHPNDSRNHPE